MAKREEKATESRARGRFRICASGLIALKEMGDLVRVNEAVSCEEEMSAIGYLVAKHKPSPAIFSTISKATKKARTKPVPCGTSSGRASRASL